MTDGFPAEGMALTHILVSSDPAASRDFYVNVLGAELYREYGSSVVLRFLDNWLLVVEGGGMPNESDLARACLRRSRSAAHATRC